MRKAASIVFVLAASSMQARAAEPLTLHDALQSAFTIAGISQGRIDVANSRQETLRVHAIPSLGIGATYGRSVQQAGSPIETAVGEQLFVDFGSPEGRIGRLLAARAIADAAVAALAQTRLSVGRDVIDAFFTVATDEADAASAAVNVDLARRSLRAAQERHSVGAAPLLDVERAEFPLEGAEADEAAARAALTSDRESLGSMIGRSPHVPVRVPSLRLLPSDGSVEADAVAASPAVSAADASLRVAWASLAVARGSLEPSLAVGGGSQSIRDGGLTSTGPSVSLGLTIPIPAGSNRADVAAAKAQQSAAHAAYDTARRNAVRAALALRAQAAAAAARVPLLRAAYDNANRVARTSLVGYRLGAVSSADLIVAQTQAAAARSALASGIVRAARMSALLKLQIGVPL